MPDVAVAADESAGSVHLQVRDLMIFIEAQRTVAASEDLQSGSLGVPAPATGTTRRSRSGRKR